MQNLIDNYGWWLLALVLIGAEMILPGYFMLWIGIAAGLMGAIVLVVPTLSAIVQALVFALLAILTCAIYWRFIRPLAEHRDDQPLLNRRGERMVGRRVVIVEPIVNGRGKVRVGDGAWLAEGPDSPAGSEVEVTACEGTTLKVRAIG
jgi:inner membrane protein